MKINKFKYCMLVSCISTVMALTSCGKGPENSASSYDEMAYDESTSETITDKNEISDNLQINELTSSSKNLLGSKAVDADIDGKELVINATANFKVDDVVKTRNKIEALTRQKGGYIAHSSINSREVSQHTYTQHNKDITLITYYREANMTVRVPKQKVSDFLNEVQKQIEFLNYQEFTAKDVTLDLYREQIEAQINKRMSDELTNQRLDSNNEKEQASNIDSITATYSAKQRQKMAEINRMMIEDQVKYSTIKLTFTQPNSVYKEVTESIESVIETEKPTFWQQAQQSIVDGWYMILTVILGIISLWWFWILIVIVYFIYRLLRGIVKKLDVHTNIKK